MCGVASTGKERNGRGPQAPCDRPVTQPVPPMPLSPPPAAAASAAGPLTRVTVLISETKKKNFTYGGWTLE